ncbi:MAG TPA: tRNA epoxyqueuosine(34) reductase QueG [Verrucomicrobiae bacterium]|jgi:epoxyqueuosine reductase|nr:tRNA epoxyqueuosine(34) reductase QueG [Verrucomicrobiae bacterium]
MKEAIRQRARELGFDDCRFTTAEAPDHAQEFQNWLAQKQHGEMGYLERNAYKRVEPRKVLANAKSIIALAASYHRDNCQLTNDERNQPGAGNNSLRPSSFVVPQIARYARFKDYHDILGERLKQLTEFLNAFGGEGARSLWYVDTGPLLERDLARRAGLGFVGKHTNLISRQLGNWIFIAEIITTLEFEPDMAEKNRCGSCSRCISACPTAAITAPFQLDARRCISYLTIELKGAIPVELRPAIGHRIYGCDDCLAVCPWNKFAREGKLMQEHARADLDAPNLLELLALDDAGFKSRFAGTPIVRTKRRGLLRNVCVALGNIGDETALPALSKAAEDSEPLIAEHARWAIEQIQARKKS